jgi:hypothetical protein
VTFSDISLALLKETQRGPGPQGPHELTQGVTDDAST